MSVCGQSGQPEEDSASEEVAATATRDSYKQKPASKLVRVLTVLAYLLSVSLAAILLSVYYVVVWRAPESAGEVGEVSARRTGPNTTFHHHHHYQPVHHAVPTAYTAGGGNTTVNGEIIQSTPENITGGFPEDIVTDSSVGPTVDTSLPDTTSSGLHNGTSEMSTLNVTDSIT
ncbi:uncharacterized protein LOC111350508 isoform X1 [Spodoptera litura]|uniref:Uncharacterized protein LOC111350508 isoform X1 n=1 Tax=Spodoptera litura TaxID=69820 RepID=A0A9J7DX46_SPOLT|nr:uncharacterized protein LOC111350508 isoform X1 [Spodoptera litura]